MTAFFTDIGVALRDHAQLFTFVGLVLLGNALWGLWRQHVRARVQAQLEAEPEFPTLLELNEMNRHRAAAEDYAPPAKGMAPLCGCRNCNATRIRLGMRPTDELRSPQRPYRKARN